MNTESPAAPVQNQDKLRWFHEARYGMFIHWGPYSVAARGEWVMNRERIGLEEYTRCYVDQFKAERFDPDQWVKLAKESGMKYMVLTTRHHDGFAMWDTGTRDFNSVKMGPKRDLVRQFVEAVRRGGLKVGLYYSVADWTHPDYPGAFERDWPTTWPDEAGRLRFIAYYREQLRELMTDYGRIDMLWYDGCMPLPLDGDETNGMVRRLQPEILINDRNGHADFGISEQTIVPSKTGRAWEACMTLNTNWGYHAGDEEWKTPKQVVRLLTDTVRSGGNFLLNIGPKADGTVPQRSVQIIREVGDWLRRNGEFLPNSSRSPFSWCLGAIATTRATTVYVHLFCHPGTPYCFAEIRNKVLSVRLVDGGKKLRFRQDKGRLWIEELPEQLDPIATTIAVEVEGTPAALKSRTSFWIPGQEA